MRSLTETFAVDFDDTSSSERPSGDYSARHPLLVMIKSYTYSSLLRAAVYMVFIVVGGVLGAVALVVVGKKYLFPVYKERWSTQMELGADRGGNRKTSPG